MVDMLEVQNRKQMIARLKVARQEIEEVLSVPTARYDPVLLTARAKTELEICRDVLQRTIQKLLEEQ